MGFERAATLLVLAALVPLGLSTKRYHGPRAAWVHANAGDVLYAAFWFFFLRLVWPRPAIWKAAAVVSVYCTLIEFSQRLHLPWLESLRRTVPGRLILGSDFDLTDLLYYAVGVALAVGMARVIGDVAERRTARSEKC